MMKIYILLIALLISETFASSSAVVFMYHRFGESQHPSTNIRLKQFEYQLNYLQENDYNVWPLSKIVNYIIDKKPLPPKTVALSIDDAYVSIYTDAYPRLKSKKFPFSIFVNTNPVDNHSKFYLTWENMREMSKNGAEFLNHSLTHDYLIPKKNEPEDIWRKRFTHEVEAAQKRLQKELGNSTNENPKLFSYPFGEYSEKAADLISSLGYVGFTQASGPIGFESDLKALSRFPMAEKYANKEGFITKLNTLPLPVEQTKPYEPLIQENNPPRLYMKLKYPLKNIGCYLSSGERLKIEWISETELYIMAKEPILPPRNRYACTASSPDGKTFWYSHLWIVKE